MVNTDEMYRVDNMLKYKSGMFSSDDRMTIVRKEKHPKTFGFGTRTTSICQNSFVPSVFKALWLDFVANHRTCLPD
jgi:hypothetical protein